MEGRSNPLDPLGESHFRIIADASSDAIISIDEHSTIVFANASLKRVFGYEPRELLGRPLTILMPEYLRHIHTAGVHRYLTTGERHINWGGIELPALHCSGRELSVEVSFGEFMSNNQHFFTGVVRDITERKRTESRRRMQAAVGEVLMESTATSEIPTRVLQAICSNLQWKVGELWAIDLNTGELKFAAAWHEPSPELENFVEAARAFVFTEGLGLPGRILKSGIPHWIQELREDENFPRKSIALAADLHSCFGFPIRAAGQIVAVMEFFNTEIQEPDTQLMYMLNSIGVQISQFLKRRRAEEEREALLVREQNARAAAEKASRLKDEFLTVVSHELRTPMTAILGWTDLLRQGALDEKRKSQAIETIARNALAQSRLVNDLLDLSTIITGKVRLNVQPLYIASPVHAAIESIRPAAEAKQIRIHAAIDPNAGPISGDSDRIQQVVWNLLSNAVKFTPKHGTIQIILEKPNSHVELRVIDTGAGITEEFLPYVFDRFRQADASRPREHGGMGIGLAIVRQLVELHGGTVGVTSPGKDRGATFLVRLPIRVLHQELDKVDPELAAPAPARTINVPELKDLKVLVVDDHVETLNLVQVILEMQGANVATASSAAQALSLLSSTQPNILISDIGMPGDDGYTLIRRVRELQAPLGQIPALALTAYAREEDRSRALWAGYDAHLAKPITGESLLAVCATIARRARPLA